MNWTSDMAIPAHTHQALPSSLRLAAQPEDELDSSMISDILYGAARPLPGSGLSDSEILVCAEEEFPGRSICVVRHWMILDVLLPDADLTQVRGAALHPSILYAQIIVGSQLSVAASVVLSEYAASFEDYFFDTRKTLYILAGRGARKHVSAPALHALRRSHGLEAL